MELSHEQKNLYRAIAELAYAIAKADKTLEEAEIEAFENAVREELEVDEWLAEIHFKILRTSIKPDLESAYNHSMFLIKNNQKGLTPELVAKFQRILQKVANVAGVSNEEQAILDRFNQDIKKFL
ncbi:MAG: hypothetical protein NZ551_01395 [Microscillaceae bacterium]|nr:hypothetical protein [Microscillaceae bacterium]MDW8459843.1 hypothetical protein [Cytophagales bacterium]